MTAKFLMLACLSTMPGMTLAASPGPAGAGRAPNELAETDRKTVAGGILLKWGGYVERVDGQERSAWAARLWPSLASADLGNLQKASRAVTYEGMRNALLGQRPHDDEVIDRMAKASTVPTKALGSAAVDLVFTPVTPCRIVDTRVAVGRLTANSTRNLIASNPAGTFMGQGGASTNCGIPANPAALALSVTALGNTTTGYLRVFPANGTNTQGSPVSMASVNSTANNDIIVAACQACASDLKVFSTANTHYAAFVTGYFMAPQVTAWECVQAEGAIATIPSGAERALPVAVCPASYSKTERNLTSGTFVVQTRVAGGQLHGYNASPYDAYYTSEVATCCRVPGR